MRPASSLRSIFKPFLGTLLLIGLLPSLQAADASGTWVWSTPGRQGGEPNKSTLVLKADGEKLTGKIKMPDRQGGEPREIEIQDGKVKGDEVTFTVVFDFGGNQRTTKYAGKVAGDNLKGTIQMEGRYGETRTREWEAKRETAK